MKPFLLTPRARADLASISSFIAQDSPRSALDVLDALEAAMLMLARHPRIGHARADLADEKLRVWAVFSFLVVYRPQTRPLEIIRVVHGAQDLVAMFGAKGRRRRSKGKRAR